MRLSQPLDGREPTYVYPALSRRLGGVALGVDLNPDHSCNWRCTYCDVPDLKDAKGPPVDVELLGRELRALAGVLRRPEWSQEHAPEGLRQLVGLVVSGRGEPTLSFHLQPAVSLVEEVLGELGAELGRELRPVLVTNGSNVNNRKVREALERWALLRGEVWFKFDVATRDGLRRVNGADTILRQVRENMRVAAQLCPTWLQTMCLAVRGEPLLAGREGDEYLAFLALQLRGGVPLRGVQLYGLSRPSEQPGAAELSTAPTEWVERFAERIRELEIEVSVRI